MNDTGLFSDTDIVYVYTHEDALQDGAIIETGRSIGGLAVYLTQGLNELIARAVANKTYCNDFEGVLHDIVWMGTLAIRRNGGRTDSVDFQVIITGAGRKRYHTLRAALGWASPAAAQPHIVIGLPADF